MNGRWIHLGCISVLAGSIAWMLARPPGSLALGAAAGAAWEYCEVGATDRCLPFQLEYTFSVSTSAKVIEGPDWESLATELGIKGPAHPRCAIFDHLGAQGWELRATLTYPNPSQAGGILSNNHRWIFQRPLR